MTRRVELPGAAELFRTTAPSEPSTTPDESASRADRGGSGRRGHDSKITVYVSAAELIELERARLALRAEYGVSVDRGRIVREAVALLLAEFDERGADSELVRRLRRESAR